MKRRIDIDLARALLVFGMIFVHSFADYHFDLLSSFVAAGFVFMTGFLLGNILLKKKSHWQIRKHAIFFLSIFLLLNLPMWIYEKISLYQFVFVFWDTAGRASFEILLPISFLLFLSPLTRNFSTVLIITALLGLFWLDYFNYFPYLLKFLLLGLAGIFFGKKAYPSGPYYSLPIFLIIVMYFWQGFYWFLLPPLLFAFFQLISFLLQLNIEKFQKLNKLLFNFLQNIGQNSLFLYIVHIPLLVFLEKFSSQEALSNFIVVTCLSMGLLYLWQKRGKASKEDKP